MMGVELFVGASSDHWIRVGQDSQKSWCRGISYNIIQLGLMETNTKGAALSAIHSRLAAKSELNSLKGRWSHAPCTFVWSNPFVWNSDIRVEFSL